MTNLEGKIQNVGIGDVILLANNELNKEIAGFVKKLTSKTVVLSHENPLKSSPTFARRGKSGNIFGMLNKGDRLFKLSGFTEFEKLYDTDDKSFTYNKIRNYRIPEADPGDVVILNSRIYHEQISGFVIGKKEKGIILAHDNPLRPVKKQDIRGPLTGDMSESRGDKMYKINSFSEYAVLRDFQNLGKEEMLNPTYEEM